MSARRRRRRGCGRWRRGRWRRCGWRRALSRRCEGAAGANSLHIGHQGSLDIGIEVVSGTAGLAHRPVTGDGSRRDRRARRPLVRPLGGERHRRLRCGRDAVAICQPGQEHDQRGKGGWGRLGGVIVADDTDELAEALVATGCVPGHRTVETALSRLPDGTFGVDHEVVGDIVPALGRPGVIVEPSPEDLGDVRRGVPIARRGVMDDQESDILGMERALGWAVRPPTRPWLDGQAGCRHRPPGAEGRQPGETAYQLSASDRGHLRPKPYDCLRPCLRFSPHEYLG